MMPERSERDTTRAALLEAYVSTHFGDVRDLSQAGLAREFPHFRQHFGRLLPADRRAAILDIGCGAGALVQFLRERGYANVTGVDASTEQVQAAARLGVAGIVHGDAGTYLRTRPAQFDVVFAIDVLEHLSRPELLSALVAARTALRPGGRIIIEAPNAAGPFGGRYRYGDLTHELAFTPASMTQALRAAGFADVTIRGIEPSVHGPVSAVRWVLWQGLRGLFAACLAIETGIWRGHVLSQNLIATASRP